MLGTYQPQSFWKCWASAKLTCKLVQVPAGPVGQFHSHHSDSIPQIGQIPIATNSVSCSYHPTLMIELDTPYWSSPKEPWSASPRPVPCRGNAASCRVRRPRWHRCPWSAPNWQRDHPRALLNPSSGGSPGVWSPRPALDFARRSTRGGAERLMCSTGSARRK